MATAGAFAGRLGEVGVSSAAWTTGTSVSGMTFGDIEKVNNPRIAGSQDTAESSSNDSAGSKEFVPTWDSGTLSFEFIADDNATNQATLWTSFLAHDIRGWRARPRGASSGDKEIYFAGIITSLEQSGDKGDVSKYTCTVQKTGAITRQNQ